MSYVETILRENNLDKTHWGERILKAEKNGRFTVRDKQDATRWVTCACGKLTIDIPRYENALSCSNKKPIDTKLNNLGINFFDHVCHDEFVEAAFTLVKIEKRAVIVAAEYHKEQENQNV